MCYILLFINIFYLYYVIFPGCLAWRVYKGAAYAGSCKTKPFVPWSMKWTVAVQGVSSVGVDEHCAW